MKSDMIICIISCVINKVYLKGTTCSSRRREHRPLQDVPRSQSRSYTARKRHCEHLTTAGSTEARNFARVREDPSSPPPIQPRHPPTLNPAAGPRRSAPHQPLSALSDVSVHTRAGADVREEVRRVLVLFYGALTSTWPVINRDAGCCCCGKSPVKIMTFLCVYIAGC